MRKTSQDGGDTSSITSGIENETKKPGAIMKTKRNSLKRKVQGLSIESDDAVIEPLLQRDNERPSTSHQSAKYDLLSKTKTETTSERGNDNENLLQDDRAQRSTPSDARNVVDTIISMPSSSQMPKSTGASAPLHNHMNTNVFNSPDALKGLITTKSQILVEIDGSKQSGYNPSPLIFTTAKIHTDGKSKQMEPLQVTPVPILSTIEVSVLKGTGSNNKGETSGVVTSNISSKYANTVKTSSNLQQDKEQKYKSTASTVTTLSNKSSDSKSLSVSEKQPVLPLKDKKYIDISSTANKDYNIEPTYSANNIEPKKEKDEKQTKSSLSKPISGPSSMEVKTTDAGGTSKPAINLVHIKSSSVNQAKVSVIQDQSKKGKSEDSKNTAQKMDLNKNIKSSDSRDAAPLETFDNKSDEAVKNKSAVNTLSTNSKQLQRQKFAIDKDDHAMKLKSGNNITSVGDEGKPIKETNASLISKPVSQIKQSANDISNLSEKTKSSTSTSNNVTSQNIIPSSKPFVTSIAHTTGNKTTTSNSITSTKPIAKPAVTNTVEPNISVSSSTVSKSFPSNVIRNDAKFTDVSSTKPQSSSSVTTKAPTAASTKSTNISLVETPSTISLPLSNIKSAKQPDKKTTVAKPVSQTIGSKPTDIHIKDSSMSTSAGKNTSISTSTTKTNLTSTAKTPPTSTIKATPETTSTAKSLSSTTGTVKSSPVTTSIGKSSSGTTSSIKTTIAATSSISTSSTIKNTAVTTSIAKSTTGTAGSIKPTTVTTSVATSSAGKSIPAQTTSTSIVKNTPAAISTAKTIPATAKFPPIQTSSTKITPISASSEKPTTLPINASKTQTTKTNIIPTTKANVVSAPSSTIVGPLNTVTTTASNSSTSNSAVSNKKTETKSTELSNGNKSLKP